MSGTANSAVSRNSRQHSGIGGVSRSQENSSMAKDRKDQEHARKNQSSVGIQEASEFISDFDAAMCRLEQLEQVEVSKRTGKLSRAHKEEVQFDFEAFLLKTNLNKKQKQALLLLILCFDADFPASVFERLCKSHTMKAICDEVFSTKSVGMLTEIA